MIDKGELIDFLESQKSAYDALSRDKSNKESQLIYAAKREAIQQLIKVIKSDYINRKKNFKQHFYAQE